MSAYVFQMMLRMGAEGRHRLGRAVGGGMLIAGLLVGATATLLAQSPTSAPPERLRLLVVSGGHSHDTAFYKLFDLQPDWHVVVEPHPSAFTKNLVRDFDVIVLYDMVQEHQVPEAQRLKLKQFAEAGKGLVVMHHALVSYQQWDWYGAELVGGRYLLEARDTHPKSLYQHDVEMTIHPDAVHPITKGIQPFRIVDETYEHMQFQPEIQVLLRTDAKGSNDPVMWVSAYPKSKVVAIQLGHDHQALENAVFRQLFRRAVDWAGGRLSR
jgi:hypothetical protein